VPTWFEFFEFEKDPYEKLDPYKIEFERLIWDRPDLKEAKERLDNFIEDVLNKKRVGLKIFGPAASGKTWLTRIVQKELMQKLSRREEKMLFLYTKVPRIEPTFQIVYRLAIEYFLNNYFGELANFVKESNRTWEDVVNDPELATCFRHYSSEALKQKALARKWLIGEKLTASELGNLEITYLIDSDYERYEMLRKLIEKLTMTGPFATCILVIDELENAPVKLAGQLSDCLRDMLDSFSEKFGLIASFTAEKVDEWYDLGYTEYLGRRFDYTVQLDSLKKEAVAEFLRLHHRVYRKKDAKIDDHLLPFTKESAIKLLELMPLEYHYPGYFLPNCRDIARLAFEKGKKQIDAKFVEDHFQKVTFK